MPVGIFNNPHPDMWYLEGPWISNNSKAANDFESMAKSLNTTAVFNDLSKGIIAFLVSENGEKPIRVSVISLSDNMLFTRYNLVTESSQLKPEIPSNSADSLLSKMRAIWRIIFNKKF